MLHTTKYYSDKRCEALDTCGCTNQEGMRRKTLRTRQKGNDRTADLNNNLHQTMPLRGNKKKHKAKDAGNALL